MLKVILLATLFVQASFSAIYSQISITNTETPQQLVENVLLGAGVTAFNFSFNGVPVDATVVQQAMGFFDANGTGFPIASGVVMGSGFVNSLPGAASAFSSDATGTGSDPDLALIEPAGINDACVIEFDFIPGGDTISFDYMFGSEEYPEFVNSGYNDAFGFFISGPGITGPYSNNSMNIALLPGTSTPVTIDNVNAGLNSQYYVDNFADVYGQTSALDAYTVVLTASASVQCGEVYHIKLAIGDAGDTAYDSAVFLAADSFTSDVVSVSVATVTGDTVVVEGCTEANFIFSRPENDTLDTLIINYNIQGSATEGVDFDNLLNPVTFLPGEDTVIINLFPYDDQLAEGDEYLTITAFTINECGDTIASEGTLWIKDPPISAFAATPTEGCSPMEIIFSNQSQNASQYHWDFGTGNIADVGDLGDQSDTLYAGTTTAYLIATDDFGCSDSSATTIYLDICGCTEIYAENYDPTATVDDGSCIFLDPEISEPNVFTPDGDEANDYFELITINVVNLDLVITNRWGNVVFQASEASPKWDGTVNGNDAAEGVYFYRYTATGKAGQELTGHGFLHLER